MDVRELIIQTQSIDPAHVGPNRPSPVDLERIYKVDRSVSAPTPDFIAIFDDVLTAGAHFRAAKFHLRNCFPQAQIIGIFVARRVFYRRGPEANQMEC